MRFSVPALIALLILPACQAPTVAPPLQRNGAATAARQAVAVRQLLEEDVKTEGIGAWQGNWRGTCSLKAAGGNDMQSPFEMEFGLQPGSNGNWDWTTVYHLPQGKQTRAYTLKQEAHGHYVVDENNGILLDQFLIEDGFSSLFTVNGRVLHVDYQHRGNHIEVKMDMYSLQNPRRSGSSQNPVSSFSMRSRQACKLYR